MDIRKIAIKTIGTFFYIGYLPLIPGTFGSIAGIFLFLSIKDNPHTVALFTFILIILGFLVAGRLERILDKKDARHIVIDEVCGVFLSLIFMPHDIKIVIIAFMLFRILDALKPFPAGRLEKFKGSVGIMGDDIVAGLYTNLILQIVLRLASFKTS
jgi:phosphatidylglycerophosphatase A